MIRFSVVDNQIATDWSQLENECLTRREGFIEVVSFEKGISNQQMKFFHACIVPLFVEYTGDSKEYWETKLKVECGSKWFEPRTVVVNGISVSFIGSKTHLTTRQFCEWYQNIVDYGLRMGIAVPPPDPEWRKRKDDNG